MSTRTITITTVLDAPPDSIWASVLTPEAFHHVTRGLISFPALGRRDEPFHVGDSVSGPLRLFGVIPLGRHHITVADVDRHERRLRTHERGGMVRTWNHDIEIEPIVGEPTRCRYTDRIEIDAGVASGVVVGFAHVFYRLRQRRWRGIAPVLGARPMIGAAPATTGRDSALQGP